MGLNKTLYLRRTVPLTLHGKVEAATCISAHAGQQAILANPPNMQKVRFASHQDTILDATPIKENDFLSGVYNKPVEPDWAEQFYASVYGELGGEG